MKRIIINILTVITVAAWNSIHELINGKTEKPQENEKNKEEPQEFQENEECEEEDYMDQYERNKDFWYLENENNYAERELKPWEEDEEYAKEWLVIDGKY